MKTLLLYISQLKTLNGYPYSYKSIFRNYFRWKKLLGVRSMDAALPWMTFDAIDMLISYVKPAMHIFEYGSGGSTLFFVKLAAEVVSAEHNAEWMSTVESKIASMEYPNWKGILFLPVKEVVNHPGSAEEAKDYISSDENYIGYNFKKYASAIDQYSDQYFDLVVIDGRARPSCIMHSINKIKPGGWIVVDNTDRMSYHLSIEQYINPLFEPVLNSFGPTSFIPNFTMTSIWRKKVLS